MDGTIDQQQAPEHQGVSRAPQPSDHALGRLDVTVPEQVFGAGELGTVSILIRNPFGSPIEVLEIQGHGHQTCAMTTRRSSPIPDVRRNAKGSKVSFGGLRSGFRRPGGR